jgi:hypothetical protein
MFLTGLMLMNNAIKQFEIASYNVKTTIESLERQNASYTKTNEWQANKIRELEKRVSDTDGAHQLTAERLVKIRDENTNVIAGLTKDVADLRALNAEKYNTIAQSELTIASLTACNNRQSELLRAIDKLHPGCLVAAHICTQHLDPNRDNSRVTATECNTMRSELESVRAMRDHNYNYNEILRLRATLRKLHQVIMDSRDQNK